MSENANYKKLVAVLSEQFQLDQPELDFGIYRILNAKRDEVLSFLKDDLLPQVKEAFSKYESSGMADIKKELDKKVAQYTEDGVDPNSVPKVKELRSKLANAVDVEGLENEVFSDLTNFFKRYYKDGDFISLRRYKKDVYAIPYEGEEVKLYWANHDQYYIKTGEYFRDYTFKVSGGKRVHFKLIEADTEKDNRKAANGNERRFILADDDPVVLENGELYLRFSYHTDADKRKQTELNAEASARIMEIFAGKEWLAAERQDWYRGLSKKEPTEKNKERTFLDLHLLQYTARNTFDYFIHKDLGGFLRRELDFYIKNEIMHLDDIESASVPKVESYLNKIKALRSIAHKIIQFLAQLENFQKKLWLKKKFVVETNYCVTLDLVPPELYPKIVKNDAQRDEWISLFAIDEIKGDLASKGYSDTLTVEFLKSQPHLVLDTKFFSADFKSRVLASFDDLDAQCDGLLIHSENFQALNLLQERYREQIECVHIDPPYNTTTSGFPYKNDYQHSSWLSMILNRALLASKLVSSDGAFQCHIDENEYETLYQVLELLGLPDAGTIVWDKKNPMLGRKGIATQHEYIVWRGWCDGPIYHGSTNVKLILNKARNIINKHNGVNDDSRSEFSKWTNKHPDLTGGERAYKLLSDDGGVFQSVAMGAPEPRANLKFHIPLIHPLTGKECPVPKNGWSRAPETLHKLIETGNVVFGSDEKTQPRKKVFLTEKSKRQLSSVIEEAGRGKQDVLALGVEFPYCHPVSLYEKLLGASVSKGCYALDYFAGSGTTGHAVINLNREDDGNRKYILAEMGEYFNSVTKPRIQKVIYSKDWKDGKPVSREGSSHLFKTIRLESYEDVLNNLMLTRDETQDDLLASAKDFRESYMLGYMLNVEAEGSQSLLNLDAFENPFAYKLKIATGSAGETKETNVDLVETFNYLIGLKVRHIDSIRGFVVVQGETLKGEQVLIIWRNAKNVSNKQLDDFFVKQKYSTQDMEYDLIYVNGDNNLENLRRPDQTWKVRLIEEEFKIRMFDVQDI